MCQKTTVCTVNAVAAPDDKIGQCIQRSALFPGRADGGTHGSERFAGGANRRGVGLERDDVAPLHLWAMPQKNFQKSTLKSRVWCIFCKLKWFHLQRRQGNFDQVLITLYR